MSRFKIATRRWFGAGNTHSKILITIVVLVCLTELVTSIALYAVFENIMQYEIFVSESDNLTQASYSAEVLFNNAKAAARQIYYDREISTLRLYQDLDPNVISNELMNLNSYKVLTDFISSIYIYNAKAAVIYTTSAPNHQNFESVSEFFDQDIVSYIKNYNQYPCLVPISRKILQWSSGSESAFSNAYTFIFYENPGKNHAVESAVVLNVDESWMRKTVNQLTSRDPQDTLIIDSRGQTVINSVKYPMLTDLSGQEFIKKALQDGDRSGYFIGDADGVESLVIHVPYKPLGWTYVRTIPYGLVMQKVDQTRRTTVCITLGTLIVALILAFLQTGKISKPIDSAMIRLRTLENEKKNAYISQRQERLRDILAGRLEMDSEAGISCLEEYGIRMRPGREFMLLLFVIDGYARFCNNNSMKDRALLKFGVMNNAAEVFGPLYALDVADATGNGVLVILSRGEGEPPFDREDAGRMARAVQQRSESLGLSLSCFIGPPAEFHTALPREFNAISYASSYKLFHGPRCVVFTDSIPDDSAEYAYPMKKEKAMLEALISGNAEEAGRILDDILADASTATFTFFNLTVNRLVFSILGALMETGRDSRFHVNINHLVSDIGEMETVGEINRAFHEIFREIEASEDEKKRHKYDKITEGIMDLIGNKYADPNISIQFIAESIHFSPSYVSRLFRQATGKSIVDYINEYRIRRAQELLTTTTLNINEIVRQIGFTNTQYFHKVFKRTFGITPNDMRRQKQD
jgi:AraC-like DNA-binding protein